ncbi:hypothetical protein AGOR_G00068260 [Albula goreensis]|uniref:FYVE-type domain-containing protein n=1 Tax=Albula goreensis TaxID=1534307 RepID=A0A8T3DLD7_9TELE|nr:hypothetical protein AGOR_G00068260 [Albula goreensis]
MLSALMRRWLNRPKRSDTRPLARFFFADEEVTRVTMELNGIDLRKDPQKYLVLLNRLRVSQDQMLRSIELVMEDCIPAQRQSRDYHVKFPDEILHQNLGVQLWFAAECLSAGSFLEVRESEGERLRPLAERMLQCLEDVRLQLREQILADTHTYTQSLCEALLRYDSAFSQFELSYVSTVIPVKSAEELQRQQEIVVLFCETVDRALKLGYLKQELIDGYEPLIMFTIPRLAIICGLLIFPDGPLNLQNGSQGMSSLFSPFFTLLLKIRDLLRILTKEELYMLEKSLCAAESSGLLCSAPPLSHTPGEQQPARAVDSGTSRRRLFRGSHGLPTPPPESESRSHINMGNRHMATCSPPQPALSPDRQGGARPSVNHRLSMPPMPTLVTSTPTPIIQDTPTATPPSPLLTTPTATPPFPMPATPLSPTLSTPLPIPPMQATPPPAILTTPTPPSPMLATPSSSGSTTPPWADTPVPPTPVRERFYYYRSPTEPGTTERPTRSSARQTWHCGNMPLNMDARRPGSGHVGIVAGRDLRSRYSSSSDMVHRLFVCISGVADQLQTNFASDMRAILKSVFELIVSKDESEGENIQNKLRREEEESPREEDSSPGQEECELCGDLNRGTPRVGNTTGPVWVPDSACDHCTGCHAPFTLLRRRHHCRRCGKIFCARCSPNEAPLPCLGQHTPVRVCNHCFNFHIVGETAQL